MKVSKEKSKEKKEISSGIKWLCLILLFLFLFGYYGEGEKAHLDEQELKPKAKDSLIIQEYSCSRCKYSKVCWKIHVWNQSDKAIKDIHFKMHYCAKSGTMIDTGEETVYEVIKGGEKRLFKFEEYLRDQVVKARVSIDNAKWIDEEGKVYLDW